MLHDNDYNVLCYISYNYWHALLKLSVSELPKGVVSPPPCTARFQ